MTNPEILKLLEDTVPKLSEHCDSVRIFVTFHDSEKGNTKAADSGAGNFYAQLGQVREWVSIQEQYQKNWAMRKDGETE